MILLGILVLVATFTVFTDSARVCKPEQGDDTSEPPPFWCALHSTITVGKGCSTYIEESYVLPWAASSRPCRIITKSDSQVINAVSMTMQRGKDDPKPVEISTSAHPNNEFHITWSTEKLDSDTTTFKLRYSVEPGLLRYKTCNNGSNLDSRLSNNDSLVAWWTPGFLGIEKFEQLSVKFVLEKSNTDRNFLEAQAFPEQVGKTEKIKRSNETVTAEFSHKNESTMPKGGSALDFYATFTKGDGSTACRVRRDCASEMNAHSIINSGSNTSVGWWCIFLLDYFFPMLLLALAVLLLFTIEKQEPIKVHGHFHLRNVKVAEIARSHSSDRVSADTDRNITPHAKTRG